MRLDMFLKQSGLVKRRPIAKALCDGGKVQRNGQAAKAGDGVRAADILRIHYGTRTVEAEVLEVPGSSIARGQRDQYFRIVSDERDDDLDF